jgi:hypothetical protein
VILSQKNTHARAHTHTHTNTTWFELHDRSRVIKPKDKN